MTGSQPKTVSDIAIECIANGALDEGRDHTKLRRVHYLRAMALAGIHDRIASSLWRMVADGLTPLETARLAKGVKDIVRRRSSRFSWNLTESQIIRTAEHAVAFILAPACPACSGRGYEVQVGTGRLSDVPCVSCSGAKIRRIDSRYAQDVLADLERRQHAMARGARIRMMRDEKLAKKILDNS